MKGLDRASREYRREQENKPGSPTIMKQLNGKFLKSATLLLLISASILSADEIESRTHHPKLTHKIAQETAGLGDLNAMASAVGIDFPVLVERALDRKEGSVFLLLWLAANAPLDGAGSEGYAHTLVRATREIGDKAVAEAAGKLDRTSLAPLRDSFLFEYGGTDEPKGAIEAFREESPELCGVIAEAIGEPTFEDKVSKDKSDLHIQKCNSGIDDPTEGDESASVSYAGSAYHVKILHPKVMDGPHFSTPFFWVIRKGKENHLPEDILTLKTHIGGLSWHSVKGYFFAEKEGSLGGFFLEDGFDNADNGSSGLIFVNDGKASSGWSWSYRRDAKESKGSYRIASADPWAQPMPPHLLKALAPVLKFAEKEANAWPGP
jgi:hypothetical protein